jgi:hypothetical protein
MRFFQGDLILSDEDRELLALATMNHIEMQYQASYFIGSMLEIKAQLVDSTEQIKSKQSAEARDSAKMALLNQLLQICDLMIERGHDAARAENSIIQMH